MKKILLVFSLLVFTVMLFSFTADKRIIVIDAGHGGADEGAKFNKVIEKDISLKIAHYIKKLNRSENVEILLTRTDDASVSLSERTEFINKINPEMVISLHLNNTAGNPSKNGPEIFFQENETSKTLATELSEKFEGCKISFQNLHILRESKSPALILELGFMSNEADRARLSSDEGQREIAEKILGFIGEK